MSSFSPVIRVRKLLDKIKSEKSPRLKRISSRSLSEEARSNSNSLDFFPIPSYKKKSKSKHIITGDNYFETLPDEATLYIFSFLNAKDLCYTSEVSRQMYSFATDELVWKALTQFDFGIHEPFSTTWKTSYALLEDLCSDGIWEGMSKWIEPAGFDNEQKTTARLQFNKQARSPQISAKSSPSVIHRVDSQTVTPPIAKTDSKEATQTTPNTSPYKVIGSGVTLNCTTPSPFRIEGQRIITDEVDGCNFEWNKHFEKHTSVYSGRMDYKRRIVTGTIKYNDGTTNWVGEFYYAKMVRHRSGKSIMA